MSLGLPIIVVTSTIAMPFGPKLMSKLKGLTAHPERTILIIAMTIAMVGLSLATLIAAKGGDQAFTAFMVIFAVSFGICNGLAYTIPLKVGWDHFPKNKGLVSGIVIGGFGLGSFIFGLISTLLINPDNSKPNVKVGSLNLYNKGVADHLILSIRILILIWSVLGISGIVLLSVKPTEDKNEGDSLEFAELI